MFEDIPRYVMKHSPECSATLPGMFGNIPQAQGDILWNVWQHFPEYNIPHILRVPRIPLPVPVFLVLYIAILGIFLNFYVVFAFDSSKGCFQVFLMAAHLFLRVAQKIVFCQQKNISHGNYIAQQNYLCHKKYFVAEIM